MPAPRSLQLPVEIADELLAAAARAERSPGFLMLGALKSAGSLAAAPIAGPTRAVSLERDEEDPRDLANQIVKLAAAKGASLSVHAAVALAWQSRRGQILAWVERVSAANAGMQADDLDDGLRAAADPATPAAKLATLANSPYPKVRALVAAHAATPTEALTLLSKDRDRVVREALAARS